MVKKKQILTTILITTILISTLFIIGAGCETTTDKNATIPSEEPETPQIEMLFSDDFSEYEMGKPPSKWDTILMNEPTIATKQALQKNEEGGIVVEVKGEALKTGNEQWKEYTISLDFKIIAASKRTILEIFFKMSDDNEQYYILVFERESGGVTYKIYKNQDGKVELYRKDSLLVIDDEGWHSAEFKVQENKFSLEIDSEEIFKNVEDKSLTPLTKGGIALGTDPDNVIQCDNVVIIGTKSQF